MQRHAFNLLLAAAASILSVGFACYDTNNGATDYGGDDCRWYIGSESNCGSYDDADFTSSLQCCACGGGRAGPATQPGGDGAGPAPPNPGGGGGSTVSPALAASAMLAGMIPENPGGDADGNYWLLAGVAPAAFWTVVLVVSQKPGPAATASNMRIPICGCLALAAVFAIAAVAHDSLIMFHNDDFKVTINHGLWRESTAYNGETIAQVDNNCGLDYGQPGPDDGSDCSDALNAKCKTSKVFAIIGITSNVFAFLPLFVAPMRDGVGVAATGLASLSYLIIFAIAASFYNGDAPPVVVAGVVVGAGDKTSSCGSGLSEIEDYGFGASFFLFITAWILTAGASILGLVAIFLASPTPKVGALPLTEVDGSVDN